MNNDINNKNSSSEIPEKTLRISNKLKLGTSNLDKNKIESSALNALKNSSETLYKKTPFKKNDDHFKKNENQGSGNYYSRNNNPNRLNDEEYKLRKLALENKAKLGNFSRNFQDIKIDERVESIIKSTKNQNEGDSLIKENQIQDNLLNQNEEIQKDQQIQCTVEPKKQDIALELESQSITCDNSNSKSKSDSLLDEFFNSPSNSIEQSKSFEKKVYKNTSYENKNSAQNIKLEEQKLDDFLETLLSNFEPAANVRENNFRRERTGAPNNSQGDFKNNVENFNSKTNQYSSGINHNSLLAKRNKIERDEKQDEDKTKPQGQKSSPFADKKRNLNVRASFLNVVNENNEEILFNKDKSVRYGSFKKKSKDQFDHSKQKIVPKEILIQSENELKELANNMNLKASDLIKMLNKLDKKTKYNESSMLDSEMASLIVIEIGHTPITESFLTIDKLIEEKLKSAQNFQKKPPVVTIMGHVDHGKTSLLDAMRKKFHANATNIAQGESGGITQHIGAYQIITKSGESISFIDTPGHEAFTAIRARGSMVTDIVILVVAADDGIMPQTIEAIRHAQAAKVAMIVAINKIDKAGANVTNILNQLIQYDVITEENGGEIIAVPISAKEGTNLDKLEETILLVADMLDLQADETLPASGIIIEARINNTKGPCATALIQNGILRVGDALITNNRFCKIRSMCDENGLNVCEAHPSKAVEIFGFDQIPSVGEKFIVLENEKAAKSILQKIMNDISKQQIIEERKKSAQGLNADAQTGRMKSIFDLFLSSSKKNSKDSSENEIKELNFIIKADVSGTIDAVKYSLEKLNNENERIKINIIYTSTGSVTESDIMLAKSSSAMICGFNVGAHANIRNIMEKEGLVFKTYTIIYQLIDDIKALIENKLKPQKIEKSIGKVLVKQIFDISGVGLIAGCEVKDGSAIMKNTFVRIKRKDNIIAEEILIKELKRGKENVREVTSGIECGIALQDYDDIMKGDILELYQMIDNV